MIDDREPLHRAVVGFGERIVALSDGHVGPQHAIRRPDAIGVLRAFLRDQRQTGVARPGESPSQESNAPS